VTVDLRDENEPNKKQRKAAGHASDTGAGPGDEADEKVAYLAWSRL